jgi:hypothetical protein
MKGTLITIMKDTHNTKQNSELDPPPRKSSNLILSVKRTLYLRVQGADKSVARPNYRCILFDGENISFDASLIVCI